jgi:F420H(2)-dependent quinone reductase
MTGALVRGAEGPTGSAREELLRAFTRGNRTVMLPLLSHRRLSAWMGSPLAGWFAVLTTTGRHSGLPRRTPLNYAIAGGSVYVLTADPPIEPGRHDPGSAWWVLPRVVGLLALTGAAVAVGQSGRVMARGSTQRS